MDLNTYARRRLGLACLLLALVTAACRPPAAPSGLPVQPPERWAGADAAAAGEVRERWWRAFEDPQLDELITAAVERNFSLAAAAARMDAAREQARIAGADRWPQVNASLNRLRQRQAFVGLPIPGREGQDVLVTTSTRAALNFELSWEADLWGRLRAQNVAAGADALAAAEDWEAARLSLAARTAGAYFRAREAARQLELARATAENFRTVSGQVRARYERGLRPSLDLRLALSNQATADSLLRQRQLALEAAIRELQVLTGNYPDGALQVASQLPALPAAVPAGVPAEVVRRRPDVLAAEHRLLAGSARREQARANLYPRFALTANGGWVSNELADVLQGRHLAWSLLGNLVQPVFQGGRLRANVRLAQAREREATALFADTVLRAFAEVETALTAERLLAEQQQELQQAVAQAVAARNLAQDRYAAGLADIITVLEAQRRALEVESQLIALQGERLQTRLELLLALGGGFERATTPPATAPVATPPAGEINP